MKNQKRKTPNEEKIHAIKREICRYCDHNSNNNYRKKKYNTYSRHYLKKNTKKLHRILLTKNGRKRFILFCNLGKMFVSDTLLSLAKVLQRVPS